VTATRAGGDNVFALTTRSTQHGRGQGTTLNHDRQAGAAFGFDSVPRHVIAIANELLYEFITYGDGHDSRFRLGNWNTGDPRPRAALTFLTMRALDVYRLPWHQDRVFNRPPYDNMETVLQCLADRRQVDDACAELRDITTTATSRSTS